MSEKAFEEDSNLKRKQKYSQLQKEEKVKEQISPRRGSREANVWY